MKLIFCLEKIRGRCSLKNAFSRQRVTQKLIEMTERHKLWMSNYSTKQFTKYSAIISDDDYMTKAETDDYCFVEDKAYSIDDV